VAYNIEILSVGDDSTSQIAEVSQSLNVAQDEFRFSLPPERLRTDGLVFVRQEYRTSEVFSFLRDYRTKAKGSRPYLVAVVNGRLSSDKYTNLFGSHEASEGLAVITLHDHQRYADSYRPYLCYYFIRYALSFVCPVLKSHKHTHGCFFDFKQNKLDLKLSLESGEFCSQCKEKLEQAFNTEIRTAIQAIIKVMKSLHMNSTAVLNARALKGQVDIGAVSYTHLTLPTICSV